jgi:hypothetical protein
MPKIQSSDAEEPEIDADQVRSEAIGLISTCTTLDSVKGISSEMRRLVRILLAKTAGIPYGEGIHIQTSRREVSPRFLSTVASSGALEARSPAIGIVKKR